MPVRKLVQVAVDLVVVVAAFADVAVTQTLQTQLVQVDRPMADVADRKDAAVDAVVSAGAAAVTTAFSSARKVTSAPVAVAKVSGCFPVRVGRNTSCPRRIYRARRARALVTIMARIAATGSAPAKAARPRVRASASQE